MTRRKVEPRKVSFLEHPDDLATLVLGSMGFSTAYIQQRTGLSACQVLYRLAKGAVRRTDYRNGENQGARLILTGTEEKMARIIRATLKERG